MIKPKEVIGNTSLGNSILNEMIRGGDIL